MASDAATFPHPWRTMGVFHIVADAVSQGPSDATSGDATRLHIRYAENSVSEMVPNSEFRLVP
jgi:hypothetical protein